MSNSIGSAFTTGVMRYLDLYQDADEMCEAARHGDSSNIDMTVGDIYG